MSSYERHQYVVKKSLVELQKQFPKARFFQRHVGLFYTKNGGRIKINQPGMSDIWALFPGGKHVEIEVKTGTGILSPKQKAWKATVELLGIKFFELRENNLQDVINVLRRI